MGHLKTLAVTEQTIDIIHTVGEAVGGDILFLVSCSEFISLSKREKYRKVLVLHASDLPFGRGWSPHIWQIIEGRSQVCVSLLEASDKIDRGDIWKKVKFNLEGHELYDEINEKLFRVETELIVWAIKNFDSVVPVPQSPEEHPTYRRRVPQDSEIDVNKPLSESFNLLRVCDPHRFPAFFTYLGHEYKITVEKIKKDGERQ
jgi:methionyl-tRNA formyltransferase